jgi:hypothetical protein
MLFECFDISQDSAQLWDQNQQYLRKGDLEHDLKFSIGLLLFQIIPKSTSSKPLINVCRMLSAEIPLKAMSCVL